MSILDNPYQAKIDAVAAKYGLDPDWFTAMIAQESRFERYAASKSNALGLTQIIYITNDGKENLKRLVDAVAIQFGKPRSEDSLFDPDVSLHAGARHLAWCLTSEGGDYIRAIRKYHSGKADPPPEFEDQQGTSSDEHIAAVKRWYAEVKAAREGAGPVSDTAVMAMKAYSVPGGRRKLYLPARIPVEIRPVDHPRVRSRQKSGKKTDSTYHDTANPRTNARGEYGWLAQGRPGGSVGGYEWIVDDSVIIITGWFDEYTWAQGTNRGNQVSHAGEHAFGGQVEWNPSLENACAMHGAVLEMEDRDVDASLRQHHFWTKKHCPGQIRNRGEAYWTNVVVPKVKGYWKAARAARTGGIVDVPAPSAYATPVMPMVDGAPWTGKNDVVINGVKFEAQRVTAETTTPLNRRQWASAESPATGPTIPAGTKVDLLGWVAGELVADVSEWWIDTQGNRLWAGGIDAEPKIDPEFGQEPEVPADDDAPFPPVPVNGRLYYPLVNEDTGELGREITIHRSGTLHKWADSGSAPVGAVRAREERVFRYWTRGEGLPLTLKDGSQVEEVIWYAEDLHTGARMWSGLSEERPD